jgi:hypothetical protein
MSESWIKKHAKNLLTTMPVDNKASGLNYNGKIDPKTGKKIGLDSTLFDSKSNPKDPRTGTTSKSFQERRAVNAAAHKKLTGGTPQERKAERARRAANRS